MIRFSYVTVGSLAEEAPRRDAEIVTATRLIAGAVFVILVLGSSSTTTQSLPLRNYGLRRRYGDHHRSRRARRRRVAAGGPARRPQLRLAGDMFGAIVIAGLEPGRGFLESDAAPALLLAMVVVSGRADGLIARSIKGRDSERGGVLASPGCRRLRER